MRIRNRFIILFFAIALAPLTLVGAIAYRNGRQAIEDSLGLLFEQRATRTIELLDREVLALLGGAQAWVGLERMQDVLDHDREGRIAAFLIEQVRRNDVLASALVKTPAGIVVAASHPDWIGRIEPTVGAVATAPEGYACRDGTGGDGGPLLTCEVPIRAAFDETKILGSLAVSWKSAGFMGRTGLERLPGGAQGELLLVDRNGLVVSSPAMARGSMLGRNLREANSRAVSLAGAGRNGFLVEELGDGEYLIGYAHSSGPLGWSALVVQEVATAFAPAYRLRRIVLGVGALAALLSLLLSIELGRRAAQPLLEIAEGARRVAGGDLDTRLTVRAGGEMGSLAESFDRMVLELKRQREQLIDKDFVDSILSHIVDGLMVVAPDGVVERVNRALVEMMASREERIVGRRAGSLFHGGFDAFRERVLEVALRGEPAREVELGLAAEDGRHVPVILSAALLPSGRGTRSIACIVSDISQRKLGEQALVKARELAEAAALTKAQFLATVSHEIRTPLNGIIGMTELLAGTRLSPQQREYVETARRSGELLLSVLNDILDFSKIDAGRLELETIEFDLRACVEGVGDILASKAREKGLELAVRTDALPAGRVIGDPARLRQVLLNLGGNAVKFTSKGEVVILAEPDREREGRVRFAVSDTGIGIPAALHGRLFRPFSQVDASTTRRFGGTGLGLAIARQIVELMRGEIGFTSEEGRGSTFFFSVELPPAPSEAPCLEPRRARLAGLRVLVVDDNATNRYVLREMLASWGCSVDEAPDAWEGLEKLRAAVGGPQAFELALVDFQMPEMDGGQLAREIKKDPRLAHTPLILLTSMPQHGDAAQMMDMGFAAYLTKPVKQTVLHDAIAAVMGVREPATRPQLKLVTAHTVGEETRGRRRILVVADSVARQQAALRALEKAGYACDVAGGGEEAVRAVSSRSYDLVFMDCDMPGIDGYEAARQIRMQEEDGSRTPIVAVGPEDDADRWRQAGMDDALGRPATAEELCRMAERYAPAPDPRSAGAD
ncbi:MAG TPA: response regulator [Vicinamibacteria bacterium]|nr:response regulator [Vicinamibacteria bacterium]